MMNHRGMAGSAEIVFASRHKETGDEVAHGGADADALVVGEADQAVLAPAGAERVGEREDDGEGCGTIIDCTNEADRGPVKFMT
jgi:hypothetical protein